MLGGQPPEEAEAHLTDHLQASDSRSLLFKSFFEVWPTLQCFKLQHSGLCQVYVVTPLPLHNCPSGYGGRSLLPVGGLLGRGLQRFRKDTLSVALSAPSASMNQFLMAASSCAELQLSMGLLQLKITCSFVPSTKEGEKEEAGWW